MMRKFQGNRRQRDLSKMFPCCCYILCPIQLSINIQIHLVLVLSGEISAFFILFFFFFIYLGVSHLLCFGGEAEKQVWSALEQLFQRQTRCVPVITDSLSTHKIMGHGNSEAFMILYLLRWVQWAASLQVTLNKYMIIQFSEKDFSWDSQSQY